MTFHEYAQALAQGAHIQVAEDEARVMAFALMVYRLTRGRRANVTSWGRDPQRSRDLGGPEGDPHEWWLACDLTYQVGPEHLKANDPTIVDAAGPLGLHVITEVDHDHVQIAGWVNKPLPQSP